MFTSKFLSLLVQSKCSDYDLPVTHFKSLSQEQRDWAVQQHLIELLCMGSQMNAYTKQKQTHRDRKQTWDYQRQERRREGQIRGTGLTDIIYYI